MYCLIDSALKMAVVCSYRILIPACQSTLSGCNTTRSIQTKYIVIIPHRHTIISHKPPHLTPSTKSFFSDLSTRTASPHFPDANMSSSLLLPLQNYVYVCCFHPVCTSTSYNSCCHSSSYSNKCN